MVRDGPLQSSGPPTATRREARVIDSQHKPSNQWTCSYSKKKAPRFRNIQSNRRKQVLGYRYISATRHVVRSPVKCAQPIPEKRMRGRTEPIAAPSHSTLSAYQCTVFKQHFAPFGTAVLRLLHSAGRRPLATQTKCTQQSMKSVILQLCRSPCCIATMPAPTSHLMHNPSARPPFDAI